MAVCGSRIVLGLLLNFTLLCALASGDPSTTSRLHWITNGNVRSAAVIGDTLYVGGSFTRVAPSSAALGAFYRLSPSSGSPLAGFPLVDGIVSAIESDGAGGYYIGGQFTTVAGETHVNLAHIKADGSVDSTFNPLLNGAHSNVSAVTSIARGTSALFVAGGWGSVNGRAQQSVVAMDPVTGNLTQWLTFGSFGVPARLLIHDNNVIVVGGSFGVEITALNQASAAVAWRATVASAGTAYDAVIAGSRLIVSGQFFGFPNTIRSLASLNVTTGALDISWTPNQPASFVATEQFRPLAVSGSTLYIGGVFNAFAGVPRANAAAIDIASATITNWAPTPNGDVNDLLVSANGSIFMAGAFTSVGGAARENVAEIDSVGNATGWVATTYSRSVRTLSSVGLTELIVGGELALTGGVARNGLAAFDLASDTLLPWSPAPTPTVLKIGSIGQTIVVGTTTDIATQTLYGLHAATAARLWSREVRQSAPLLLATDDQFAYVNEPPLVLRVDANGVGDPVWRVNASGVRTLAVRGETIFLGGAFVALQNAPRRRLGAVDRATAAVSPWAPTTNSDFPEATFSVEHIYADDSAVSAFELTAGTYAITGFGRYDAQSAQRVSAPSFRGGSSAVMVDGATVDDLEVRAYGTIRETGATATRIARGFGVLGARQTEGELWNPGYTLIDGDDRFTPTASILVTPTDLLIVGYQGVSRGVVHGIAVLPRRAPVSATALRANVVDNRVTLSWVAPTLPPPSGYLVYVGRQPGGGTTSLLTSAPTFTGDAPNGTYFISVRGIGSPDAGAERFSNEIAVAVGCPAQAFAPMQFGVTVTGARVTLSWSPPLFVAPSGYVIEAATMDGAQRFTIPIPSTQLQYVSAAPAGTYVARIRATHSCRSSEPSGDVSFTVGASTSAPSAPTGLQLTVASSLATIRWDAVPGASGYVIEVGRGPGQADFAVFRVTNTEVAGAIAPLTTYYVRVRATNAVGASAPSRELVISTW
jgi:hypothetical protein